MLICVTEKNRKTPFMLVALWGERKGDILVLTKEHSLFKFILSFRIFFSALEEPIALCQSDTKPL